jgi:hypothetical protein
VAVPPEHGRTGALIMRDLQDGTLDDLFEALTADE